MARGALRSACTSAGGRRPLERLGFAPPERERSAVAVLAWAFAAYVCVFVVFMLGPALVLRDAGGEPGGAPAAPLEPREHRRHAHELPRGTTSPTTGWAGMEVQTTAGPRPAAPGRRLIKIAMIATIQVLTLAIAVVPKRHLGFASEAEAFGGRLHSSSSASESTTGCASPSFGTTGPPWRA